MKRRQTESGFPGLMLLALSGMVMLPSASTAQDAQAEREARRIENEARRAQEQARRDMEARERAQAEALRSQQQAIQRMEATQARMNAESRQMDQRSADQARSYSYPYYPGTAPVLPAMPVAPAQVAPVIPAPLPIIPLTAPSVPVAARRTDAISQMSFAPLTERLKSYFGAQSGVLVVSAGAEAPFTLQDGDVIISVDGRAPADGPHVAQILRTYRPGEHVKLRVQRDRRTIDIEATAPEPRGN